MPPIPSLPRRRADIVFPRAKLAVFVDGCFWHGCPQHGKRPMTNESWWRVKLDRVVVRDRETNAALAQAGWRAIRVWEHDDAALTAAEIDGVIRAGRDA